MARAPSRWAAATTELRHANRPNATFGTDWPTRPRLQRQEFLGTANAGISSQKHFGRNDRGFIHIHGGATPWRRIIQWRQLLEACILAQRWYEWCMLDEQLEVVNIQMQTLEAFHTRKTRNELGTALFIKRTLSRNVNFFQHRVCFQRTEYCRCCHRTRGNDKSLHNHAVSGQAMCKLLCGGRVIKETVAPKNDGTFLFVSTRAAT
jgi:hypothetical protein